MEAAWAAIRVKKSYFRTQYARLKRHLPPKKAIVAVAHSILGVIYHLLKNGTPYQDLGTEHFQQADRQAMARGLKRRIESLGFQVTVQEKPHVA